MLKKCIKIIIILILISSECNLAFVYASNQNVNEEYNNLSTNEMVIENEVKNEIENEVENRLEENKNVNSEIKNEKSSDSVVKSKEDNEEDEENDENELNSEWKTDEKKENNNTNKYKSQSVEQNDLEQNNEKNKSIELHYSAHVQNIGWQNEVNEGVTAGTEGKSLRVEAIKITTNQSSNISVSYQTHIQDIGWQNWKQNGQIAGTEGKSKRIEAIKIKLNNTYEYSIMYRVHIQDIGWQDWKYDGEIAGTEGKSKRIEAIQIKIVKKVQKGMLYVDTPQEEAIVYNRKNVTIKGWKMSNTPSSFLKVYVDNSEIQSINCTYYKRDDVIEKMWKYGSIKENPTPGFTLNLGTSDLSSGKHYVKIELYTESGSLLDKKDVIFTIDDTMCISYRTHIQDIGWQNDVKDGATSGTEGKAKRIEALQINLNNAQNGAKVLYKTHVQDIGWQSWKSNGELAGTEGRSKRIEAIQIKLENMDEYTIEYQVHIQDYGWSDWYIDGETAGTIARSKRIEAIRIRIVKKYKRGYMGIDVSQYNGDINWANVKNSGIDFAMIRVGFRGWGQAGNFKEDANFKTNIQNAKAAGLKVGVYFVTQAKNDQESIQEANWVLDKIRNYHLDYPVALDIEASTAPNNTGRADNLDKNTRGRLARSFCQTIQNSGYVPMIYLNVDWAKNRVDMSQLTEYDTWIANYKHDLTLKPSYSGKYTIWQYTDIGRINGINTKVDVNISYKRYE